jgi:inorganic pyrophosphatase
MESDTTPYVPIYIEIEKGSNLKYEYNKTTKQLDLDRVLPPPHVYPYSYGFIPNTLGEDGDELDVLVVSESSFPPNTWLAGYIIGALLMSDEKGVDHKILAVLKSDFETNNIRDIYDLPSDRMESIQTFFANYKKNEPGKWSVVDGFVGRNCATKIYKQSLWKKTKLD